MMSLSRRQSVSIWIALAALVPALFTAVAFSVWLDARWHWPLPTRWWSASVLDETWVWSTALVTTLALALISRFLSPDALEGRRNQLNSPIDDETHILRLGERSDGAAPCADVQRSENPPPRARHSP